MPMLADIDDPPRPRGKGLLIGALVALPLAVVFIGWLVPQLVGTVLSGAQNFDQRLRMEDGYLKAVCTQAMTLPRDEALCECVLAVEFPALDCQAPFLVWSVERHKEHCADPAAHDEALSFCTCVDAVEDQMTAEVEGGGDGTKAAQAYRNCQELPDAVDLPPVESLAAVTASE